MSHAWIGLGSNLGQREEHLRFALRRLRDLGLEVLRVSHLYETAPAPPAAPDEPAYLNAVLQAETERDPAALLALLHKVEIERGRDPERRSGPRPLDLDLLAVGTVVEMNAGLQLPHPRLADRAFVLVPLCELDPLWRHPTLDLTSSELLGRLEVAAGEVRCAGPLETSEAKRAGAYPWRLASSVS